MKIDIEKTSELKNLLKVGTEHTVGYQGSTRKQGIVADSIMVAEETLYSKAANNNVEEVFAVDEHSTIRMRPWVTLRPTFI